jgi:phage tail-like protein
MPESAKRNDPFASFNFLVSIGTMTAGFSEIGGLSSETTIIEYRQGDYPATPTKQAGQVKFANINMKRGYTNNLELWDWRKKVMDGKTERLDGTITLLDESRKPALVWTFQQAWPSKWAGPAFNAKNNDIAIEELEICVEGLEVEKTG